MSDGTPIHIDEVEGQSWEIGDLVASRKRLGHAADAERLGVAIIEVSPGMRPFPAHAHVDEDEVFLVLEGSGLSYQTSGSKDIRTYEIGVDDVLLHQSSGDAHTVIAGEDGLTVLVVAEGSRTGLTWLPRAKQFWIGRRWSPADMPPPFIADAELGALDVPAPESERPPTIRNLSELTLEEGRAGDKVVYATRDAREMGSNRLVLAHDAMPPDSHNTDLHFHSAREECWFVRGGGCVGRMGDEGHELRAGSFWLSRPNDGVGHRVEVGPDGMDLITMGDLIPGDICIYPEKGSMKLARGVEAPIAPFEGE
ncbi:hypothetical protein BH10ACT11_BH10ACT11_18390 [soil metagenome]